MAQMMLGIDVSRNKLDVALLHAEAVRQATFANNPAGLHALAAWLAKQPVPQVHACLEATGRYGDGVAHFLHAVGHTVSVVNPAQIQAFARSLLNRNKTDRSDALLIARFCAQYQPTPWTPPPAELRALQELVRRQAALQQMRQQEANRLAAGLASEVVRADLEAHLRYLDEQLATLEAAIKEHIEQHPALRQQRDLLTSIPGIGAKTAAIVLGEVGAVAQFTSAAQLAAYAGLTPRQHQSGSSVKRPARLCKTGNAALRKALYYPALTALRYNPIIQAIAQRLRKAGKRPMQIVGAAMRKLLHLIFGVLKSGQPFDPHYGQLAA
jgi:transposase